MTWLTLPGVYMNSDDAFRASELGNLLTDYIKEESAKFITGARPLSEVDQYFEELRQIGVEEYIEMYRAAYSDYIKAHFG